ncbi:MAG: VOC family protein [Paracoccaceae bacterium]|nr:VOC family protein [Paracoccaceae bacterium]
MTETALRNERVNLITLGVADLARSRDFYARLGWKPVEDLPNVTFYRLRGAMLGLFGREALAKDQGRPGTDLGTGAITLAQNFPSERDVDVAFDAALTAGATPLKPPEAVFWGGYSGYFADPDGHVWELAHNPFWPLDADGFLAESETETGAP